MHQQQAIRDFNLKIAMCNYQKTTFLLICHENVRNKPFTKLDIFIKKYVKIINASYLYDSLGHKIKNIQYDHSD